MWYDLCAGVIIAGLVLFLLVTIWAARAEIRELQRQIQYYEQLERIVRDGRSADDIRPD